MRESGGDSQLQRSFLEHEGESVSRAEGESNILVEGEMRERKQSSVSMLQSLVQVLVFDSQI
jgi:hypothetical protein